MSKAHVDTIYNNAVYSMRNELSEISHNNQTQSISIHELDVLEYLLNIYINNNEISSEGYRKAERFIVRYNS